MTTLKEAFAAVNAAGNAHDLFNGDKDKAQRVYRDLAKVLHPDHVPASKLADANAAFAKLSTLWDAYSSGDADRPFASTTIATRKRAYVVGDLIAQGDIAGIYRASYREDDKTQSAVLKVTRSPANNDLVENEARVLKHLADEADPLGLPYFSQLLDAFRYRDATSGVERRVNVVTELDGFYSLAQVKEAYPAGLDVRDAAWIWKRLLIAIGHAHRAGYVHGAVVPDHVLVHPEMHGLTLIDWCYSQPIDSPIRAMVGGWDNVYPLEVFNKEPATSSTDIYMASKTIETLFDTATPKAFRAFIKGCTLGSPSLRPEDSWEIMRELTDLLAQHFGPRKFRPFVMPGI